MARTNTTISHVATRCGVSQQTVSNVLNKRHGEVSVATRERVLSAAREMNYFPSAVARGLVHKRMNTLGVVMSMFAGSIVSHEYAGPILDRILETLTDADQDTMLFTGRLHADLEQSLSAFCDGRCDGLLMLAAYRGVDIVGRIADAGVPVVLVGYATGAPREAWVKIDNEAAMHSMTSHLIGQGHRKIAFFWGHEDVYGSKLRHQGYRRALIENGVETDPNIEVRGTFTSESGRQRALDMFTGANSADRPTAIACSSDAIALGAIEGLHSIGLRVPGDVSVTGFDDVPGAAVCSPPLTTVRQPLREMGRRSAQLLLDLLAGKDVQRHVALDFELVSRGSVAPPAKLAGQP